MKYRMFWTLLWASFLWTAPMRAQEIRMWIPSETQDYYPQLKNNGVALKAEDFYSVRRASLNDAVLQFNGGCTGSVISPEGLVLTNHHCGYGAIAAHSTLEHNYVENGFWAYTKEEELPNPGMYVTFVRAIYDVTGRVLQGVSDTLSENARQSLVDKNIHRIKKQIPHRPWQEVEIKPVFYGNKYYAYVTETYRDIRLVGAPPSSIGKFGADTDNWMWPRHSGDFSLFRIYADKHNRPADYSPDNVPYKPKRYLQVNQQGVKEGDLIIVYGFPGRTREYLPAYRIRQIVEKINPVRIAIRRDALDVLDGFMRTNDTIKLQYTSQYARIANYWKKWKGENLGIRRSGAIAKKDSMEQALIRREKQQWGTDSIAQVLAWLRQVYDSLENPEIARNVFIEAGYLDNPWTQQALAVYRFEQKVRKNPAAYNTLKNAFRDEMHARFRRTDTRVNRALFGKMWDDIYRYMPRKDLYLPVSWTPAKWKPSRSLVLDLWQQSFITDSTALDRALNTDADTFLATLDKDRAYGMARDLINAFYGKINPAYYHWKNQADKLMRQYVRLQMELFPGKGWVPDANSTLRLSFGHVKGYQPRDGVYYEPISTLDGVIEKYIPGDYEFDLPAALLDIYRRKDYGPYASGGTVPVDFLGTAHTTGGNSGSPAVDKNGRLVGLNFDRVWEGTMSDLYYDPSICRNIMVDTRYIMFIIDKLGHAQNLIDEINQK